MWNFPIDNRGMRLNIEICRTGCAGPKNVHRTGAFKNVAHARMWHMQKCGAACQRGTTLYLIRGARTAIPRTFSFLFRTNFINTKVAELKFEIRPTLINAMCIITELFGIILANFKSIDFP